MDDGGRCLLDVISDPLALEYFLGTSGNDTLSDPGNNSSCSTIANSKPLAESRDQVTRVAPPHPSGQRSLQAHPPLPPSPASSLSSLPVASSSSTVGVSSSGFVVGCVPTAATVGLNHHVRLSSNALVGHSTALPPPSLSSMPPPPPSLSPHLRPNSIHSSPIQFQVRSPSPHSTPFSAAAATIQLNKVPSTSMAPAAAAISILQSPPSLAVQSPSGTTTQTQPQATALPAAQIMQFIPTAPAQPAPPPPSASVRLTNMKPIQPKPQQILPKPAGGASQTSPYHHHPHGKLSQRPATATATMSLAPGQASPLVIGQTATATTAMLQPNSNVTVGPQGTLVLNHFSVMGGQNQPFIIPGGAGLPANVQLLVRPQQTAGAATSQAATTAATQNNAALLAALQQQTAFKALPGQTVVIPNQAARPMSRMNLGPTLPAQATPLVLQQIQGPITVIQALQGANVGVGGPGITLANPTQLHQIATAPGIPQGIVISSQPAPVIPQNTMTSTAETVPPPQPPTPPQQPKPLSVSLEELLKQAGIVDDSPIPPQPSPPPQPQPIPSATVMPMDSQPIMTFAPMAAMQMVTSQCLPEGQMVVSQDQIAHTQLLAHLQQPVAASQLSSSVPTAQVKLSLAQDGSVIIQRPAMFQPAPGLTLASTNAPDSMSLPVAVSLSTAVSTTPTTTTVTVTTPSVHSVLLQRLTSAPQTAQATPHTASSLIPLALQGISMLPTTSWATTPTTTNSSTILSSMLGHSPIAFANQEKTTDDVITAQQQPPLPPPSPVNRIVQNSPLLVHSLQTFNGGGGVSPVAVTLSSDVMALPNNSTVVTSSTANDVMAMSVGTTSASAVTSSANIASVPKAPAQATPAPSMIVSGYPIQGLQPGQKVQTIQLTPQGQEALQRVQSQIRTLLAQKSVPPQQWQQLQQLQNEQQRIISQGKLISVQHSTATPTIQNTHIAAPIPAQTLTTSVAPSVPQKQQVVTSFSVIPPPQPLPIVSQNTIISSCSSTPTTSVCANTAASTAKPVVVSGRPEVLSPPSAVISTAKLSNNKTMQPNVLGSPIIQTAVSSSGVITTTAGPTHLKIGNQLIALPPQQPSRLASAPLKPIKPLPPSSDTQQLIYQNQAKQALIVKLQQQAPPGGTAASTTGDGNNHGGGSGLQTFNLTGSILQIQSVPATTTVSHHLKPLAPAIFTTDQGTRGVKRPISSPVSTTALLHQHLSSDQNAVLTPDCKTPFIGKENACKRLMQYHVFNGRTPTVDDLNKADTLFDAVSEQLLEKAKNMLNKYRYLLIKESMREASTCEKVMLDRMFIQEETASLERDRKNVKEGLELELPPPPAHWLPWPYDPIKTEEDDEDPNDDQNMVTSCEDFKPPPPCFPVPIPIFTSPCIGATIVKTESKDEKPSCCGGGTGGYDEWAAIQKELEMYPLETSTSQLDFDVVDSATTLADFEPPVPKLAKGGDGVGHVIVSHNGGLPLEDLDERTKRRHYQMIMPADSAMFSPPSSDGVVGLLNGVTNSSSSSKDDDEDDDDLNAQVQSAINSILNLQRIDDSCDSFALSDDDDDEDDKVSRHNPQNVAVTVGALVKTEDDDDVDDEDCEEDEEMYVHMAPHTKDDPSANSYNSVGVAATSASTSSDIDVALDEAVKSILL